VDYKADAEGARVRINDWTSEQTHARIPQLIGKDVLDHMTRLVLVNAVYLKAPWEHPFRAGLTQPRRFTRRDGSIVQAPTMSVRFGSDGMSRRTRYAKGDGWQAAELPYAGSELAMTVVLPDKGRLAQVERAVAAGVLRRAVRVLEPVPALELRLPKWTFRRAEQLNDPLSALGMPTAFSPESADFSGITDEAELYISHVLHEAFVAVDEQGTEAAAATAVVVGVASAGPPPPEPVVLDVDRPFFFVIHDVASRTPRVRRPGGRPDGLSRAAQSPGRTSSAVHVLPPRAGSCRSTRHRSLSTAATARTDRGRVPVSARCRATSPRWCLAEWLTTVRAPERSTLTRTATVRPASAPVGRQAAPYVAERRSTTGPPPAAAGSTASSEGRQCAASGPMPGSETPIASRYAGDAVRQPDGAPQGAHDDDVARGTASRLGRQGREAERVVENAGVDGAGGRRRRTGQRGVALYLPAEPRRKVQDRARSVRRAGAQRDQRAEHAVPGAGQLRRVRQPVQVHRAAPTGSGLALRRGQQHQHPAHPSEGPRTLHQWPADAFDSAPTASPTAQHFEPVSTPYAKTTTSPQRSHRTCWPRPRPPAGSRCRRTRTTSRTSRS
jgi:hypothetical protein